MVTEEIKSMLDKARKEKNHEEAGFLSMLYSEIVMIGKNNGNRATTKEEALKALQKAKHTTQEVIQTAMKNGRTDVVSKSEHELKVIESFLPVEKTKEELDSIIESYLSETDRTKKAMGIVMKKLKENFAGQYDGKMASEILKAKLN
jgi:DNA phosphorothioation-dependent restriction protein DptG